MWPSEPSCGDSIGIGDYVTIRGLVKRSDLNSKVAKVVHIPSTDSERVGVNILGDDFNVKISNLDNTSPSITFLFHIAVRLSMSVRPRSTFIVSPGKKTHVSFSTS